MTTLQHVLTLISPFLQPNPTYFHLSILSTTYCKLTPTLPLPSHLLFPKYQNEQKSTTSIDEYLHKLPLIATGTYSTTHISPHPLFPKVKLAVKLSPKRLQLRLDNVQQLGREINIIKTITKNTTKNNHPFISHLSTLQTPAYLCMITNLIVGGELFTHLHHKHHRTRGPTMEEATNNNHHTTALSSCPPTATKFYIAQLVLALNHLHTFLPRTSIIHRDLRQENILISSSSYLKLCDFGNARWLQFNQRAKTLCGVPESTAPEMFIPNSKNGITSHGTGVDWWALGVLSYELNVGWSPFYSENPMDIYGRILASDDTLRYPNAAAAKDTPMVEAENEDSTKSSTKGKESSKLSEWDQAKSFTLGLLERDEKKRLGSKHVKKTSAMDHFWFHDIDWENIENQTCIPPRGAFFPSHDIGRNFEFHALHEDDPPEPIHGAKGKMIWNRWCGGL
jgi:serine/threonine protein kinase